MKSKFKKIIFSLFVMFLSTFVVYAEAPTTITINGSNVSYANASDYLPNYDVNDGQNISIKVTTDGLITYCINPDDPFYTESITYTKGAKLSDQVACIISNGYNTNNTSSNYNYFTTNLAIWSVVASDANKVKNFYNFPNGTYKGTYSNTVAAAYTLANSSCDTSNPTISVSSNVLDISTLAVGNYYVSSNIPVTQTGNTSGYTVSLSNAPAGTKITDTSGVEKTTFTKGSAFKVMVPKTVTSSTSFSVNISANYSSIAAYTYTPNSNTPHQSVALLTTETTTKSTSLTLRLTVQNTTDVVISKQDITTHAELAGAYLVLKTSSGASVDDWTSTTTPHTVTGLTAGTYVLSELSPPNGYVRTTETVTFTVNTDGTVTGLTNGRIVMYNTPEPTTYSVTISKQDSTTHSELAGAILVLKNSSGQEISSWITTTTPRTINDLSPGTYTLSETSAPNGYIRTTTTKSFTINANGTVTGLTSGRVVLENTPKPSVTISKQDITNRQELAGAKLVLKNSSGTTIDSWTSTTTPHVVAGLDPGTYTLSETIAPEGYIRTTTTKSFTVNANGTVTGLTGGKVIMYNEPEPVVGRAVISKQDVTTNDELPGAKLVLKNSSGSVVDQWTSSTTPHVVNDLAPGTYSLTETTAPDGYIRNTETITFTIDDEGKVVGGTVIMYNEPKPVVGKIIIIKHDATTNKPLAGAVLVLKDASGTEIKRWTTTKNGYTIDNLAPGRYTISEVSAPKGYILNTEPVSFRVNDDGTTSDGTIIFKNHKEENPQTGSTLSIILIIAALLSLGCSIYYIYKAKKSNV